MSKINVGDEVYVKYEAWSSYLNYGILMGRRGQRVRRRADGNTGELIKYRVIGMHCTIPVAMDKIRGKGLTNTLLLSPSGVIWAINDCNLEAIPDITVRFMSNGQDVTDDLSEKSKQAVLLANNY